MNLNSTFDINWTLIMPLLVVWLVLLLTALISCIKAEQTKGPKWMWMLIIIFVNIFGPILYFVIGRKDD